MRRALGASKREVFAQLLVELVASIRSMAQPPRHPLGADEETRGPPSRR